MSYVSNADGDGKNIAWHCLRNMERERDLKFRTFQLHPQENCMIWSSVLNTWTVRGLHNLWWKYWAFNALHIVCSIRPGMWQVRHCGPKHWTLYFTSVWLQWSVDVCCVVLSGIQVYHCQATFNFSRERLVCYLAYNCSHRLSKWNTSLLHLCSNGAGLASVQIILTLIIFLCAQAVQSVIVLFPSVTVKG